MIDTITVWQVRKLTERKDVDNLKFISRVFYTPSHESYSKVIFKEVGKKQLYIFYWIKDVTWVDDDSDWDMSNVETIENPFVLINVDANINNYHVKVYPVKAKKVTITRYIRED